MNQPRTLEVPLTVHGYKLKLDTDRCDCMEWKYPHWHLWNRDRKIGTITAEGVWKEISYDIKKSVRNEVEQLTHLYANRIREDYHYNLSVSNVRY